MQTHTISLIPILLPITNIVHVYNSSTKDIPDNTNKNDEKEKNIIDIGDNATNVVVDGDGDDDADDINDGGGSDEYNNKENKNYYCNQEADYDVIELVQLTTCDGNTTIKLDPEIPFYKLVIDYCTNYNTRHVLLVTPLLPQQQDIYYNPLLSGDLCYSPAFATQCYELWNYTSLTICKKDKAVSEYFVVLNDLIKSNYTRRLSCQKGLI